MSENPIIPSFPPPTPSVPPEVPKRPRRGVLNARHVRIAAFALIALSIFVSAVVCILAVWDYANRDTAWKALASLGIIAAAMASFVAVNEAFGPSIGE